MTFDTTGLTEVIAKRGRKGYVNGGKVIAVECLKCGEVKREEGFYKDRGKFLNIDSRCKECRRIYHEANREDINEKRRNYREANRDKISEQRRIHYEANRDIINERNRKYREDNRDKIAEYYKANRDKFSERNRIYRENNRDKESDRKRIYRMENLEKYAVNKIRRRARIAALPDDLTVEQWAQILEHFDGACALSGEEWDGHRDHVIPISIGHGGTIYENMIPLRADLNMSKGSRNIFDWFADNRDRFGLEQRRFDELIEYLAEINEMTTKEYEEYVRWCHDNPRTNEEIEADNERYGFMKPSSEIWREEVANKGRELVEA